VISRRTIIWFVLLLGFSAGLKYDAYQEDKPCRDWKAAHPGVDPKTDVGSDIALPDGMHEVSLFNSCTVVLWRSMPVWVKLCTLGWLVALIGFLRALSIDVYRWVMRRKLGRGLAAQWTKKR
jgi:hypothetical protein